MITPNRNRKKLARNLNATVYGVQKEIPGDNGEPFISVQ